MPVPRRIMHGAASILDRRLCSDFCRTGHSNLKWGLTMNDERAASGEMLPGLSVFESAPRMARKATDFAVNHPELVLAWKLAGFSVRQIAEAMALQGYPVSERHAKRLYSIIKDKANHEQALSMALRFRAAKVQFRTQLEVEMSRRARQGQKESTSGNSMQSVAAPSMIGLEMPGASKQNFPAQMIHKADGLVAPVIDTLEVHPDGDEVKRADSETPSLPVSVKQTKAIQFAPHARPGSTVEPPQRLVEIPGEDEDMASVITFEPRSFGDLRRKLWSASRPPEPECFFYFDDGKRASIPFHLHNALFSGSIANWEQLSERLGSGKSR